MTFCYHCAENIFCPCFLNFMVGWKKIPYMWVDATILYIEVGYNCYMQWCREHISIFIKVPMNSDLHALVWIWFRWYCHLFCITANTPYQLVASKFYMTFPWCSMWIETIFELWKWCLIFISSNFFSKRYLSQVIIPL